MSSEPGVRPNGTAIRVIRELEKRTVADVARYAGLKAQSLRNIENGHRSTGREVIRRIAEILDVPVAAITADGTDYGSSDEEPEAAAVAA